MFSACIANLPSRNALLDVPHLRFAAQVGCSRTAALLAFVTMIVLLYASILRTIIPQLPTLD